MLVVEPVMITSHVSFGKEGKIPPQVAVYEQGIAFLQSVKRRRLKAKIPPCFTPCKYTRADLNENGIDTTTFCKRLYTKDYLKERKKCFVLLKGGCSDRPHIYVCHKQVFCTNQTFG